MSKNPQGDDEIVIQGDVGDDIVSGVILATFQSDPMQLHFSLVILIFSTLRRPRSKPACRWLFDYRMV